MPSSRVIMSLFHWLPPMSSSYGACYWRLMLDYVTPFISATSRRFAHHRRPGQYWFEIVIIGRHRLRDAPGDTDAWRRADACATPSRRHTVASFTYRRQQCLTPEHAHQLDAYQFTPLPSLDRGCRHVSQCELVCRLPLRPSSPIGRSPTGAFATACSRSISSSRWMSLISIHIARSGHHRIDAWLWISLFFDGDIVNAE